MNAVFVITRETRGIEQKIEEKQRSHHKIDSTSCVIYSRRSFVNMLE
jgi:hypothetical protein